MKAEAQPITHTIIMIFSEKVTIILPGMKFLGTGISITTRERINIMLINPFLTNRLYHRRRNTQTRLISIIVLHTRHLKQALSPLASV